MLGKRSSRPILTNPSKSMAMSDLAEKRSIKLPLFLTFSEPDVPKSPTSPLEFKISSNLAKSPRGGWEKRDSEGIGLGIVAAMNKTSDTHDAFSSPKAGGAAITAGSLKNPPISPRSQPIPIVSAKNMAKSGRPKLENNKMVELSESYTCVIYHQGPTSIKKFEYFDTDSEEKWRNSDVFGASPLEFTEIPVKNAIFEPANFLSSCYLCRKKLHGRDIFMYRGDKAFCSVECRCQQILSDEHKEKCGSVALKPFDYSVSPCSAPRLFSAGVAVA